jgi:hypothetical protein
MDGTGSRDVRADRAGCDGSIPRTGEITAFPRRIRRPRPLRETLPGLRHRQQRIVYAEKETNYARPARPVARSWLTSMSRLLRDD